MAGPESANAPMLSRYLGLPEDADEASIVEAIRRSLPWPAIAEALGLSPGSGPADCIAVAERLKAEEEAKAADLRDKLRTARVKIVMLEAIREAGDTLEP